LFQDIIIDKILLETFNLPIGELSR
jgi:hypothetical protein